MVAAATEFKKSGFDDSQSAVLAQTAAMFQNVADEELSAADASSFLISQMMAFNIEAEDSLHIVDAINKVANEYAVSSGQLSSGLNIVASSSAVMGNSLEETIGLMTAITEVTRNANKASRGLNSIMVQLAEVLDDTSATGKKITKIFSDLGISMYDSEGQLKSGYELLSALSEEWKKLDSNSQKYIATTIATKTQLNNFVALMENFQHATNATSAALHSTGSATEENRKYMFGLEAQLTQLKATFENFANNVINSTVVKSLLGLANGVLEILNNKVGGAITRILLFSTALIGIVSKGGTVIKHLGDAAKSFFTYTKVVDAATGATQTFASVSGIAVAGIGLLITVVGELVTAWYEARFAELEAGEAATKTLRELEDLTSKYEQLRGAQTNGRDVSQELSQVSQELNAHFEENGIQLDNLVEKYGSYAEAIRAATEEERLRAEQDLAVAKQAANELAASATRSILWSFDTPFGGSLKKIVDTVNASISPDATDIEKAIALYDELYRIQGDLIKQGDQESIFYKQVKSSLSALEKVVSEYRALIVSEKAIIADTNPVVEEYVGLLSGQAAAAEAANKAEEERISILNDQFDALDGLYSGLSTIKDAYNQVSESGRVSYKTLSELRDKIGDNVDGIDEYIIRLSDANLTAGELENILSQLAYAYADNVIQANGLTDESYNLISAMLQEIGVVNSDKVALDIMANAAINSGNGLDFVRKYANLLSQTGLDVSGILAGLNGITNTAANAWSALYQLKVLAAGGSGELFMAENEETYPGSGIWIPKRNKITFDNISTPTTSGGGGGGSQKDERLETLKDEVSLLESELDLLEKQNKPIATRIGKIKQIQEALHNQAEYMRSIGASQEEINKLSSKWWSLQNDINSLLKEAMDIVKDRLQNEAEEIEDALSYAIKMAEKEVDAINDKYDKQLETLENSNDALNKQIQLEEKLNAIAQARAKKLYVFKDGRFQYVDDVDAISEAQKDYQDFLRDQELENQKNAIEAARQAELKTWEDYIANWENVVDGYKDSQDRLLAEQVLGIKFEQNNWAERLGNAQEFARKYASIMNQISSIEKMQESASLVDLSVDYSALMDKAKTAEEFDYWASRRDIKAEVLGIDVEGSGYRTNEQIRKERGFASGTYSAPGGLSIVGENGPELRVLNSGDGILPADITRNLWDWGKINPSTFNRTQSYIFNIDNLSLPHVTDSASFLSGLKQMAYQRAYRRA